MLGNYNYYLFIFSNISLVTIILKQTGGGNKIGQYINKNFFGGGQCITTGHIVKNNKSTHNYALTYITYKY